MYNNNNLMFSETNISKNIEWRTQIYQMSFWYSKKQNSIRCHISASVAICLKSLLMKVLDIHFEHSWPHFHLRCISLITLWSNRWILISIIFVFSYTFCSSKYGIYQPNCGLEKVTMSWGHDGITVFYFWSVNMGVDWP